MFCLSRFQRIANCDREGIEDSAPSANNINVPIQNPNIVFPCDRQRYRGFNTGCQLLRGGTLASGTLCFVLDLFFGLCLGLHRFAYALLCFSFVMFCFNFLCFLCPVSMHTSFFWRVRKDYRMGCMPAFLKARGIIFKRNSELRFCAK